MARVTAALSVPETPEPPPDILAAIAADLLGRPEAERPARFQEILAAVPDDDLPDVLRLWDAYVAAQGQVDEERRREEARNGLLAFTQHTFPGFRPNWHHYVLASKVDAWIRGEITRLIVSVPPRMGKSELISRRLPPLILGRDPDARIIACSHTAPLGLRFSRLAKRVIGQPSYAELFPETRLGAKRVVTDARQEAKNAAEEWEIVGHAGGYRCAGVGGSITGFGGGYIIIDDPIKSREKAESETEQAKLLDWYNDDLFTRLENEPGCILLVATRWSDNDLTGQLLRLAAEDPDADQWHVVNFPAIRVDDEDPGDPRALGEPLWPEWFAGLRTPPEKMPPREELIARAVKRYRAMEVANPYGYAALQQGRPQPRGGGIIRQEWCSQRYSRDHIEPLLAEGGRLFQSWDLRSNGKGKQTSYAVGHTWFSPRRYPGRLYLLWIEERGRWGTPDEIKAIIRMRGHFPAATRILIEDAADGRSVTAILKDKIPGIIPVPARDSKTTRLEAASTSFQAMNVWLPERALAHWIDEWVAEVTGFPSARFNDRTDEASQAINDWQGRHGDGPLVIEDAEDDGSESGESGFRWDGRF